MTLKPPFPTQAATVAPTLPRAPAKPAACVLAVLLAVAVVASPYSTARPKRLTLQHVARVPPGLGDGAATAPRDSGLWIVPMDYQQLDPLFPIFQDWRPHAVHCDHHGPDCYLAMPWFFPFVDIVRGDVYVPGPPPDLPEKASLTAHRRGDTVVVKCDGPSHQTLVVRGDITGWAFRGATNDPPRPRLRAERVFLVQLTHGATDARHHVLELHLAPDAPLSLALAAHHLDVVTPELVDLETRLPDWSRGAEWGKHASEFIRLDLPGDGP